jgi:hypothetical protein
MTAAELEDYARLHGLVPVPPHLVERVLQQLRDHRAAMRRVQAAGLDFRDVFPAQVFRP